MSKLFLSMLLSSTMGFAVACSKTDFAPQSAGKQNEDEDIENEKEISRNRSSSPDGDDAGDGKDKSDNGDEENETPKNGKDPGPKDPSGDIEGDDSSTNGSDKITTEDGTLTLRTCSSAETDAVWFQKGIEHARGCWYLGYTGESCDTVCTKHGGVDEHYIAYSGSQGTDQKCLALADAFEKKVPAATLKLHFSDRLFSSEAGNLGCGVMPRNLASEYDPKFGQMVARVTGSTTASDGKRPGYARFCSCKK